MPGLDSLLIHIQSKFVTLTALQNSMTNINNIINSEIQNLQSETKNIEIANPQDVSKESHCHTSHTDFMYQRNNTKNDNRTSRIIKNQHFTYQRKI